MPEDLSFWYKQLQSDNKQQEKRLAGFPTNMDFVQFGKKAGGRFGALAGPGPGAEVATVH